MLTKQVGYAGAIRQLATEVRGHAPLRPSALRVGPARPVRGPSRGQAALLRSEGDSGSMLLTLLVTSAL
jgi:hypothetical protein